jgi:hypothetical protein
MFNEDSIFRTISGGRVRLFPTLIEGLLSRGGGIVDLLGTCFRNEGRSED